MSQVEYVNPIVKFVVFSLIYSVKSSDRKHRIMGNTDSKVDFRVAVVQLTSRSQQIESHDESFWDQFWSDKISNVQDIFTLIPAAEIRSLREEMPSNLATLCNKLVDRLQLAAEHSCQTQRDQTAGRKNDRTRIEIFLLI